MTVSALLDSAGRRRSPATLPGFHSGRAPRNKGMRYPADPPTVEEIVCVSRHAGEDPHGWRLHAMIVMLWRGGLRVHEALALTERDLDPQRGPCSCAMARAADGARSAWTCGAGSTCGLGSHSALRCRLARSSASFTAPRAGDPGRLPRSVASFAGTPPRRGSGDASLHTSCATLTLLSLLARECP